MAVYGVKGGIGASTVAHNFAWSVARSQGVQTVIADLDIAFGTAGLNFNQDPPQGVAEAASAAGTSERTLARRLQSVLGKTPLSYFQDLRVEHAVHLLRTGNASVDQVAAQVGYSDGVTLRALLRRKLGRGVRELRRGA